MIVVSDTSAITSLIQIRLERILPELFSRVLIPTAVWRELKDFHAQLPVFLEVLDVRNGKEVEDLCRAVDRGEAEAIILAEERSPDYLLIDDFAARRVAMAKGLPVIGLLGVLVKAKRAGLLDSLGPVISDLENVAGFRISPDLRIFVLKAAGE